MRREGKTKRQPNATRPFGSASTETLKLVASGPTAKEQREMARELQDRDDGLIKRRRNRGPDTHRPFEEAQTTTLRHFVEEDRGRGP